MVALELPGHPGWNHGRVAWISQRWNLDANRPGIAQDQVTHANRRDTEELINKAKGFGFDTQKLVFVDHG